LKWTKDPYTFFDSDSEQVKFNVKGSDVETQVERILRRTPTSQAPIEVEANTINTIDHPCKFVTGGSHVERKVVEPSIEALFVGHCLLRKTARPIYLVG